VLRTADAANARLLASQHARPAAALPISSVKIKLKANNCKANRAAAQQCGSLFSLLRK
jgi:hypothetical protein